jgi:hypothetical protein
MTKRPTIAEIVDGIDSLEELNGFTDALRDPTLRTRPVSEAEWAYIANRKIELQRGT